MFRELMGAPRITHYILTEHLNSPNAVMEPLVTNRLQSYQPNVCVYLCKSPYSCIIPPRYKQESALSQVAWLSEDESEEVFSVFCS